LGAHLRHITFSFILMARHLHLLESMARLEIWSLEIGALRFGDDGSLHGLSHHHIMRFAKGEMAKLHERGITHGLQIFNMTTF
jgi:hypothetical protein